MLAKVEVLIASVMATGLVAFIGFELSGLLLSGSQDAAQVEAIEVEAGEVVRVSDEFPPAYFGGFFPPEPNGVWLGVTQGLARIRLVGADLGSAFRATFYAPEYPGAPSRTVAVNVNGNVAETVVGAGSTGSIQIDLDLKREFDIRFACDPAQTPPNGDVRKLCVMLLELVVVS